ncbi:hypothetical protein N8E89_09165 [Phyllobacterium sp. A18/5-2]|uniref:hypothetical protein n=1 Tax=Phyllobacterium sp. A18/5-2 TaxID=2978392 RepID=UPI0021CA6C82|nr:hypothetical protein [Phyllobacterium sp. A18/5-2]UXN62885.1 hypothetical protein N8E89_09165 [Phyllobacterium sp. A18/5-2]
MLARLFSGDSASIRQQARELRDAGLMNKEKGGRGIGSMTPRDATNLLIGVSGTSRVKDSARPVLNHGRMMAKEGAWQLPFFKIPELTALGEDHTFADAIEALVRSASSGAMQEAYNKAAGGQYVDVVNEITLPVHFEITLHEPFVWSSIEIIQMDYENPDGGYKGVSEKEKLWPSQAIG